MNKKECKFRMIDVTNDREHVKPKNKAK